MPTMTTPGSDEQGIRQVIKALLEAGYTLDSVFDSEEDIPVRTEDEAAKAITDVDMAHLHVFHPETDVKGWVFFVLGNDPEEVVNNYTVNLGHVIDPLTEGWWL